MFDYRRVKMVAIPCFAMESPEDSYPSGVCMESSEASCETHRKTHPWDPGKVCNLPVSPRRPLDLRFWHCIWLGNRLRVSRPFEPHYLLKPWGALIILRSLRFLHFVWISQICPSGMPHAPCRCPRPKPVFALSLLRAHSPRLWAPGGPEKPRFFTTFDGTIL